MKKLLPLFVVLALALAGCQGGGGTEFAGMYTGTFTIIKNNTTKPGSVRITDDPLSTNGVRLYGVRTTEENQDQGYLLWKHAQHDSLL